MNSVRAFVSHTHFANCIALNNESLTAFAVLRTIELVAFETKAIEFVLG